MLPMPYRLNNVVTIDGTRYEKGAIVSNAIGEAILAEHPAAVTRLGHDDGVCPDDCPHYAAAPAAPAPVAVAKPPAAAESKEG